MEVFRGFVIGLMFEAAVGLVILAMAWRFL
jgi:hypothetical protein